MLLVCCWGASSVSGMTRKIQHCAVPNIAKISTPHFALQGELVASVRGEWMGGDYGGLIAAAAVGTYNFATHGVILKVCTHEVCVCVCV
jgi:hypothetical protein